MKRLSKTFQYIPKSLVDNDVEDRTMVQFDACELNVFETRSISNQFSLKFNEIALTAMVKGKKVMHFSDMQPFEYFPDELVIVPSGKQMLIDFPEASDNNPTQCLAICFDENFVSKTIGMLNDTAPKIDSPEGWQLDKHNIHFAGTTEIFGALSRLGALSKENDHISRGLLADFTLKELIVRLMQTQARIGLVAHSAKDATINRFAHVMHYIKDHLDENLTIDKLSQIACMSKPNFFKAFKKEFGISPIELILKERVTYAKNLLKNPDHSISEVCFNSGFNNMSHFFRVFKKQEGLTPKSYQLQLDN
ncbi:AraC family transcriptional regulator [Rhizosphaericola mali]|uniref:AraC family transcriptional regulator n=1 Tax=Rhizosphaericola mali TaxID=2545455 RepID=A0A5P2G6M3_9BACT|nr:AraC family transcriptional regulator [Rhizosphaericola mali]QES87161.1 AraC family transcriptional regulator [Rhizosphaericola mali]